MVLKLIHLSDLHFHVLPRKVSEWRSKRFPGALNLLLRRAWQHPLRRNRSLVQQVAEMSWDHLVISGDLTQLGLEHEFELARMELEPLLGNPDKVTIIPGNHDRYVSEPDADDGFTRYFGDFFRGTGEVHAGDLANGWRVFGWDSCHPNPWWSAAGTVRRSSLLQTDELLQSDGDDRPCLLVNHYPLTYPEDWVLDPHHELYNLVPVREWLMDRPRIRLYLHGHIHQNWIHHRIRKEGPELILVNSAASSQLLKRGQRSSFHQIVIDGEELEITPIRLKDDK